MSESAILTCMDMIVRTQSICDLSLKFRATSVFETPDSSMYPVERTEDRGRLCLKHSCYTVPLNSGNLSWKDAQDICSKSHGSLASINTAEEWELITRNGLVSGEDVNITLLPLAGVQMLYIGYRTTTVRFCRSA